MLSLQQPTALMSGATLNFLFSWMVPGQILKIKFQENPDCIKHEHQDKILINPGSDQLAKIAKTDKPAKNLADKENLIKKKL